MNEDLKGQAKARIDEALKQTQAQTGEAASQLGALFKAGAKKLKEAIQRDIDSRG